MPCNSNSNHQAKAPTVTVRLAVGFLDPGRVSTRASLAPGSSVGKSERVGFRGES